MILWGNVTQYYYILSVPATSAFTGRVFSVINVKWRYDRNKASLNLIKNELFIYFNMNIECNDAIETFQNNKNLQYCLPVNWFRCTRCGLFAIPTTSVSLVFGEGESEME